MRMPGPNTARVEYSYLSILYAYAWRRNWGSEVKAGGVPEAHSGSRRDSRSCRAAARRSRSLAGSVRCAPGSGRDRRTWRPLCTPSAPRSPKLCLQADRVRANISWNKAQQLLVNKQAIRLEVRNRSQRAIADEDKYSLKGCLKQWLSDCEIFYGPLKSVSKGWLQLKLYVWLCKVRLWHPLLAMQKFRVKTLVASESFFQSLFLIITTCCTRIISRVRVRILIYA